MTRSDNTEVPDYPGRLRLDGGASCHRRRPGHRPPDVPRAGVGGPRVFLIDKDPDLAADIAEETGGIAATGDATNRADAERLFAERSEPSAPSTASSTSSAWPATATCSTSTTSTGLHHDIVLRHAFLAMQLGGRACVTAVAG